LHGNQDFMTVLFMTKPTSATPQTTSKPTPKPGKKTIIFLLIPYEKHTDTISP
jgi:hypothetical protein